MVFFLLFGLLVLGFTKGLPGSQSVIRYDLSAFTSLRGPHITTNFPDPCIIQHNGTTYVFATNNRKPGPEHVRVQIATSTDNTTWAIQPQLDALPAIALWQTGRAVWAPDVKRLPNGWFLLYYTDSLATSPQTHCIGAAVADTITGPYTPHQTPLICPHGGAIDPAGFLDRHTGKRYIIYKIDGNSLGHGGSCRNDVLPIIPTPLMLQEVDPADGTTLVGAPVQLLDRDVLDGPLIEAPAMFLSPEGVYFLFFSSNCFTTPLYDTSYATATNITGPYVRAARPLLITGDGPEGVGIVGPGGLDIIHRDYASSDEIDFDFGDAKKKISKHDTDGHLVVFHGHMTPSNTPSDGPEQPQRPIQDLHRPFVRGMYSATAYFKGRSVTLRAGGFIDTDADDHHDDEEEEL